jgi:hypothetical protein
LFPIHLAHAPNFNFALSETKLSNFCRKTLQLGRKRLLALMFSKESIC